MKREGVFIFIGLLFLAPIFGLSIEPLFDQPVLQPQDLAYYSCVRSGQEFDSTQFVCLDDYRTVDVQAQWWNESCYYSIINLQDIACNSGLIESFYVENNRLEKTTLPVQINKVLLTPKDVIAQQRWDGGWGTARDTAVALWALHDVSHHYQDEIEEGKLWLKNNRDDLTKCWSRLPNGGCDYTDTALTLGILRLSQITDEHRIISDGQVFLSSIQNYIEENSWKMQIRAIDDATCTVYYQNSRIVDNVTIEQNEQRRVDFTADYSNVFNVTCSQRVDFSLYDHRNIERFSHRLPEDGRRALGFSDSYDFADNATYNLIRIPPPCWSTGSVFEDGCSVQLTTYAAALNIDDQRRNAAKEYLLATAANDSIIGRYLPTSMPEFDTMYYLLTIADDPDDQLLSWVLFNQNNDGSFGRGSEYERILSTSMAIDALSKKEFDQKNETLRDAAHYISKKYAFEPFESVQANAATFRSLYQNRRPLLKIVDPQIFDISSSTTVLVHNPTNIDIMDIRLYTTGQVRAQGPETIFANQTVEVQLSPNATQAGDFASTVTIEGNPQGFSRQNLTTIHARIQSQPQLVIVPVEQTIHVYEQESQIQLQVREINGEFTCDIEWSSNQFESQEQVTLRSTGVTTIPFTTSIDTDEVSSVLVELLCQTPLDPIEESLSFTILTHTSDPFFIDIDSITHTRYTRHSTIPITNLLNSPITVDVEAMPIEPLLEFDSQISLDPGQTKNVRINHLFTREENVTIISTLTFSANGREHDVEILINFDASTRSFTWLIILILIIVIVGGIGTGVYYFKDSLSLPTIKGLSLSSFSGKKTSAIDGKYKKNMIEIVSVMKRLDKTDDEIQEKLKAQGFPDGAIVTLMNDVSEIEEKLATVKHEDTVLEIVKQLNADSDIIIKMLKDKGFKENDINQALKEIATDTDKKDKQLRKDAGLTEDDKL
ncbi:MAG: hypothetical protein ACMXYF_02625 [Candidatus Woesearchaeota archaeon]